MSNLLQELEKPCEWCNGKGVRVDMQSDDGFSECYKCGGSGFIPTHDGAKILALMRHNSRVKVNAELRICGIDG